MPGRLKIVARPKLKGAKMVLGLSGWMDGGNVSTGTVRHLIRRLRAKKLGEIDPEGFYIYSFPGSMEVSALFRPYTKIQDGVLKDYRPPGNTFYSSEPNSLILFQGKEPNFQWPDYAECIFAVASAFDVEMVYFIGSVAGLVPHTREPRLFGSVSEKALKADLEQYGIRSTNYEGPASIVTFLLARAGQRELPMVSLVAEIPAYVQGGNPKCIESVVKRMAGVLGLQIRLDALRARSEAFEKRLNEIVQQKEELANLIKKLEEDYDNEVFDTQMGDLKAWLQQQGIRLD